MNLEECRKKIDEIDKQLVPLFVERMQCSEAVARDKIKNNLPIFNGKREQEILDRVYVEAEPYGIEARMLYSSIMSISRMRQHNLMHSGEKVKECILNGVNQTRPLGEISEGLSVACVGRGSYANIAAKELFPKNDIVYLNSHKDVFTRLDSGDIDIGVLPVENSSAGSVNEVYDLIMKYRFSIIASTTVHVRHCLAAPEGATIDTVRKVTSHPQALSQCSEFIARHSLEPINYANTALAAEQVSKNGDITEAVICSELAAKQYGLTILEHGVQNIEHNRTRFLAIKKDMEFPSEANKISLCFSLCHSTGTLYNILGRFAMHGLNLTKIESRPVREISDEFRYNFYLDFEGVVSDKATMNLICELSTELENFSFLGNYVEK